MVKIRNDYSMLGGEGTPRYWGNKLAASNSPGWDDPFPDGLAVRQVPEYIRNFILKHGVNLI